MSRWLGKYSQSIGQPARIAADVSTLAAYLETNCYTARPPAKRAARAVAIDLEFFGVSGFEELRDGAGTAFLHCDESRFLHVWRERTAEAHKTVLEHRDSNAAAVAVLAVLAGQHGGDAASDGST